LQPSPFLEKRHFLKGNSPDPKITVDKATPARKHHTVSIALHRSANQAPDGPTPACDPLPGCSPNPVFPSLVQSSTSTSLDCWKLMPSPLKSRTTQPLITVPASNKIAQTDQASTESLHARSSAFTSKKWAIIAAVCSQLSFSVLRSLWPARVSR